MTRPLSNEVNVTYYEGSNTSVEIGNFYILRNQIDSRGCQFNFLMSLSAEDSNRYYVEEIEILKDEQFDEESKRCQIRKISRTIDRISAGFYIEIRSIEDYLYFKTIGKNSDGLEIKEEKFQSIPCSVFNISCHRAFLYDFKRIPIIRRFLYFKLNYKI